jgi:hypothetical protein
MARDGMIPRRLPECTMVITLALLHDILNPAQIARASAMLAMPGTACISGSRRQARPPVNCASPEASIGRCIEGAEQAHEAGKGTLSACQRASVGFPEGKKIRCKQVTAVPKCRIFATVRDTLRRNARLCEFIARWR